MTILPLGHASFLVRLDGGLVVLLDPWFGGYPWIRRTPPALRPREIPRVDLMLVSHNHIDHVDRFALKLARDRGAAVVGPPSVARRARRHGVREVVGLAPGGFATLRGLRVRATTAEHPLCTGPIGFFLEADGSSLYFSGDTRSSSALVEEVRSLKPRAALLQASSALYFGRPDGMTEETAAEFARAVRPHWVVPMHLDARMKTPVDLDRFERRLDGSGVEVLPPRAGRELTL